MFVGGVRWVQLLNNSDKNLTLDGFIIAVCAAGAGAGTISSLHPAPWSAEIREGVGVTSHQSPVTRHQDTQLGGYQTVLIPQLLISHYLSF